MNDHYDITDLLTLLATDHGEELSVIPGQPVAVQVLGEAHPIVGPPVSPAQAEALLHSLADTRQMIELKERGAAEFVFTFRGSTRFRIVATRENNQVQFRVHSMDW